MNLVYQEGKEKERENILPASHRLQFASIHKECSVSCRAGKHIENCVGSHCLRGLDPKQ